MIKTENYVYILSIMHIALFIPSSEPWLVSPTAQLSYLQSDKKLLATSQIL